MKKEKSGAAMMNGKQFMGIRDTKKVAALLGEIERNEKAAGELLSSAARFYYEAGSIIAGAIRQWKPSEGRLNAAAIAKASGFPERRITIALKIFRGFESNPAALDGLALRDALRLVAPPPPPGEEGYNRIDLGGDPGQMRLDFGELFDLPAAGNRSLQNYRTVGDLISEIIVVRRTADGGLVSKRFASFCEDIPQNPQLRMAYKAMSSVTQEAIENYLAAVEREEAQA
jgi:hypothetical protein